MADMTSMVGKTCQKKGLRAGDAPLVARQARACLHEYFMIAGKNLSVMNGNEEAV